MSKQMTRTLAFCLSRSDVGEGSFVTPQGQTMAGLQAAVVEKPPGGDEVQSDHREEYLELASHCPGLSPDHSSPSCRNPTSSKVPD